MLLNLGNITYKHIVACVSVYMCRHAYVYIHICIRVYIYTHKLHVHIYIYIYMYVCVYIKAYIHRSASALVHL